MKTPDHHQRALKAIEKLLKVSTARAIEKILGLSNGYISKLQSGKRRPSKQLARLLVQITQDPEQKLREIRADWEGPPWDVSRRELSQIVYEFLCDRSLEGEVELVSSEDWIGEGDLQVIGSPTGAPNIRLLLQQNLEDDLNEDVPAQAVYVSEDWSESETVDLIVASFMGYEAVVEDWPAALELARERALLKEEILKEKES